MAKSDSFFIRAEITGLTGGTFDQTSIDLGAYVDALGKSVMRIHRVAVQYDYDGGTPAVNAANGEARVNFQLTTQSQTALVNATDKSVISTGHLDVLNASAVGNTSTFIGDALDISPQEWTNGYLIGVEQIYLGGSAANFQLPIGVVVVMECTVETLSQSAAMALALSQQ